MTTQTEHDRVVKLKRFSASSAPASVLPIHARYRVRKEADGKVRVFDVPIYGENVRDFGGPEPETFDVDWLRGALSIDRRQRADGYAAPMHFGHHEPGVDRERAGVFEQKYVGLRSYQGKPRWITFADLVFDDEEKYARFKREYVYRSIEISPEKPTEINSLALLASEAPYFRFPIPTQFNFASRALPSGGTAFLWRTPMSANAAGTTTTVNYDAGADATKANAAAAPSEPKKDMQAAADPAKDPMAEYMEKCDARFAAIEKALGIGEDYAAEGHQEPDGDEAAPGVKKEQKTSPVVAAAAQAQATAENLALRARLEALERDKLESELLQKYSDELAPWLSTPQLKHELKKCVKQGEAVVKAFATGLRNVKPTSPRASEGAPVETIQDEPEVAKYATHGPAKHAEARRLAAVWKGASKDHYVRRHDLATWLRHNVGEV